MICVSIHKRTLAKRGACPEGMALFTEIAALQPESDTRRLERIRIPRWTSLHTIWPYVAGYSSFARWLEEEGLIPRTNLRDTNLRDANLRDTNLRDANLRGANLRDTNLRDANLRDTNLRDANLRGANLRGAYLYGADLRGADLYGANLYGAYRESPSMISGWRTSRDGLLERDEEPASNHQQVAATP